jgi:D-alanyl-D-alanine carboxypeptidase/D-alanyl-D-alanine-endopeptidase (penicillin-binding protein 4)
LHRALRPLILAAVAALPGCAAAAAQAQATAPVGRKAPAAALGAAPLAHLRGILAAAMRRAGPQSGALVVDLASGGQIYALRPTTPRVPASVEKLYTTATALARLGPGTQLQTGVDGVGTPDAAGVWHGDLFVAGAGDPTFGTRAAAGGLGSAADLAETLLTATGITRVDGAVIGDESLFDSRRGEPASAFLPDRDLAGQLSGLAFNRGQTGKLTSPAAYAAGQVAAALRASGVKVTGRSAAGVKPATAHLLASVGSPPVRTLVAMTDLPSDNFFAEMLLKGLGARFGGAGTTAAGAAVVLAWLAHLGIRPQIVDGSGLSDQDRTTPAQVVALLRAVAPKGPLAAIGADLLPALPVAGQSGTLIRRMRGTSAAGRCRAKTGTLLGVSTLAGICDDRFAFAFLMNSISDAKAHSLQDRMTVALAAAG